MTVDKGGEVGLFRSNVDWANELPVSVFEDIDSRFNCRGAFHARIQSREYTFSFLQCNCGMPSSRLVNCCPGPRRRGGAHHPRDEIHDRISAWNSPRVSKPYAMPPAMICNNSPDQVSGASIQ
jgi:hypothetical protein